MKIRNILMAFALCSSVLVSNVSADVIDEPFDSGFYSSHYDECRYIDFRRYRISSNCGAYSEPNGKKPEKELKKGEEYYIFYEYFDKKGKRWGCINSGNGERDLWVSMDNAVPVYDAIAFEEDHSGEFRKYGGELDGFAPEKQTVLWEYPSSERINEIIEAEYWFNDDMVFTLDDLAGYVYNDNNGDDWVHITYLYNGWIYVPDPESEAVRADAVEIAADEYENFIEDVNDEIKQDESKDMKLPFLLAAAAAAVSLVLIAILKKRG